MSWEKYKWYILGYVFYASIVLASIWNEGRDFWPLFIIWCITVPLALYIVGVLVTKFLMGKRSHKVLDSIVNNSVKRNEGSLIDYSADLVKSWTLVEFAKLYGKMQVGDFTNRVTGEAFKSCIFTDKEGNTLYVSFCSKLGVLSPEQIKNKKEFLKVGLLNTNRYVLYED